jgi:hypothetical protein
MPPRQGAPAPMFSMGLPTPQPILTRPFLGIDWLDSELNLKPGALLDAQNVSVRPKGLYRIPGYDAFVNGAAWSPADVPCLLMAAWGSNGVQYPFLFTSNFIFLANWVTGYARVPWTYAVGTVTTSGVNVTGSGTLWKTLGINPGDVMTINSVNYTIAAVVSDTSITLTTSAGTQGPIAYSISRLLNAGNNFLIDACQVNDITLGQYLVGCSPGAQLFAVTPQTQAVANLVNTAAKQPTSGGFTSQCVAYMLGRVFAGNLQDGSNGQARTRIRWSKATDTTDFSDPTAYIDLMSQSAAFSGGLQRMVPLGTMLICYLDDAIFVGTPSNTPNLPLSFQQIPSGNVGLVGSRAVASLTLPRDEQNIWGVNTTGHFFVGFDNIYFLSASNLSLSPIGSKIVRESILRCQYPARIQASIDWNRKRVRFGFPRSNPYIENIFEYDWETKEWSYEPRTTWMIADLPISSAWNPVQMQDVLGNNMLTVNGYNMNLAFGIASSFIRSHYVEHNGALWYSSQNENAANPDGSANILNVQTPDYDEGAPGMVKFWRLLRLKITWEPETPPSANIYLTIEMSLNRGRNWRTLGIMLITQGNDEGYLNFRATGPHIRFRITSSTVVTPYYITEMSRLCSIRGVQQDLRQQNAIYGN